MEWECIHEESTYVKLSWWKCSLFFVLLFVCFLLFVSIRLSAWLYFNSMEQIPGEPQSFESSSTKPVQEYLQCTSSIV